MAASATARNRPRACAWLLIALTLGACATRSPHYYADDGPPERVPTDLAATPDAVPRFEPLIPRANRPYAALGRTYMPDTSDAPFRQRGIASWYGRQFQGNRTSSGEPYDMFAMTAAHPTLPIPCYARVTNTHNGRSVIVRINDRGPFLRERIIDLSYAAATRLGIAGPGSGEVTVEKITARDMNAASAPLAASPAVLPAVPPAPVPIAAAAIAPAPPIAALPTAAGADTQGPAWSVQLGAFATPALAEALRERVTLLLAQTDTQDIPAAARAARVEFDGKISRVLIGGAADRATANALAQVLQLYLARDTTLYFH